MKYNTRTVTERYGEHLGPIDYSLVDGIVFGKDVYKQSRAAALREIDTAFNNGKTVRATTHGGDCWMFCMQDVVAVGMWDGYPYWKPYPSVCLQGPLGAEWQPFDSINHFSIKENA